MTIARMNRLTEMNMAAPYFKVSAWSWRRMLGILCNGYAHGALPLMTGACFRA
jgi:hypothetical protein